MNAFDRLAAKVSSATGSPYAFGAATALILVWLAFGPVYGFTDTMYQLAINSSTTIITFLMVFLLQGSSNRDNAAIQLKLDALIKANERMDNRLMAVETRSIEEIKREAEQLHRNP